MFSEKLIKARTDAGLTQGKLAEQIYVTRQAVSRWENGKTEPDIQMLARICAVLHVSADYFIEVPQELVKFEKMPKGEQACLRADFGKLYNKYFVLMKASLILSILGFCGCVGVLSSIIIRNIVSAGLIFNVVSTFLIGVSMLLIFFNSSMMCSKMFNRWLFEKRVVRNSKFVL